MNASNTARFSPAWSSTVDGENCSREFGAAAGKFPALWQLMHSACTRGETSVRNTSSGVSAPGVSVSVANTGGIAAIETGAVAIETGAVDRFDRWPAGPESRLITCSGCPDSTTSCRPPLDSPSDPASPAPPPEASSAAV